MVIRFQTQEPIGASGANQESAAVPSNFVPLGEATQAVVLRLSSELPRLRVYGCEPVYNSSEGDRGDGLA